MPVALGAFGERGTCLVWIQSNDSTEVDVRRDHSIVDPLLDLALGHRDQLGELLSRDEALHSPLPSMASAVLVVRRSRTTSETDFPVVADLVASHVISSVVRSSIGKGIIASCMAMHEKYAIACISKAKNARKVIFYFGCVTEGCIFRA